MAALASLAVYAVYIKILPQKSFLLREFFIGSPKKTPGYAGG